MKASLVLFAFTLFVASALALGTPTDYFSEADEAALRTRLTEQLRTVGDVLQEEDYYAVAALASLSAPVPNSAQLCAKASDLLKAALVKPDAQAIHRSLGVISALKCDSKPSPADLSTVGTKLVESVLSKKARLADVHAALAALQQITKTASPAVTIPTNVASGVVTHLSNLMDADGLFRGSSRDEEGTAGNAGLAYHALALVRRLAGLDVAPKKGADGTSAAADPAKVAALKTIAATASHIEQILGDADEEDDHIIQFEDPQHPIRATSLFFIGAEALARTGETVPVTEAQITKLAQFFLHHKRASNAIDAYHVLRALKLVASNAWKKSPLVVTLPTSSVLASAKGEDSTLKIRVTDVFGKPAPDTNVYITKVYPVANEKQVILHNQQASPVPTDKSLYSFNLLAAKPDQGLYSVDLSVNPAKNSPLFGAVGVVRSVKVVVTAELSDVAIQVLESPEEEEPELASRVAYPEKVADVLKANPLQHVLVSFRVRSQGRSLPVQQAFVVFRHEESGHEVILPAVFSNNKYKVHLNMRDSARAFQGRNGKYSVHLLVGDAFLHRPFFWHFADISLSLGKQKEAAQASASDAAKGLKPEIHHQFRKPEKRPPPTVSLTFTGLVVGLPVLVLLIGLYLVGANIRNFPTSGLGFLSAVGFHACIIAVIGLYTLYWLRLTMVETLIYLLGLGVVTIIVGWQALRHRFYARVGHAKEQ